jgi:hypothetical protein
VARLVQVNRGDGWPLVIVISVPADRIMRLGSRILELAELRIDLEPWDEADTAGYLSLALAQAGCKSPVFTDDAVRRLQTVTGGVPRRVNQLAALALVAGAGRRLPRIDADTIESVYQELGQIEAVA